MESLLMPLKTSPRVRGKGCSHKKHFQKLPKDLYSCHVSPLPVNIKEHELVKIFKEYDDLYEVFISQREHKTERYTFGFVRFESKKSADHAVQYVKKNIDGFPLVVSHSKNSIVSRRKKSMLVQSVLDKYFARAFEETWESFDDPNKPGLDSILKSILSKKLDNFNHEPPTCAFSVDITETTTENIDYKLWRTFFREQNDISRSLREISKNQGSQDTKNLGKYDSTQSKSFTKEKKIEKSSCVKEIFHSKLTSQLDEDDNGLRSFCTPDPENSDVTKPSYESKARKPNWFDCLEFSSSDGNDDRDYSIEDEIFDSFEEEEPRKNGNIIADQKRHVINLPPPNCYPLGRGKGLALACHNTSSSNQICSLTQFYRNNFHLENSELRHTVKNTSPKIADIEESQFPNQKDILGVPKVYSDSRFPSCTYNDKAALKVTKSSSQRCNNYEKFAD